MFVNCKVSSLFLLETHCQSPFSLENVKMKRIWIHSLRNSNTNTNTSTQTLSLTHTHTLAQIKITNCYGNRTLYEYIRMNQNIKRGVIVSFKTYRVTHTHVSCHAGERHGLDVFLNR